MVDTAEPIPYTIDMLHHHRLFILAVIMTMTASSALGQVEWTKYQYNPVMTKDTTLNGIWEWAGIGQPSCLYENDTFKMWYAAAGVAYPGDTILRGRIGYAISVDGSTWVKREPLEPVLDVGDSTAWDARWCDTPALLNDGYEYKLYYYGDSQSVVYSAIGIATSPDGISFTRYGNEPILERSPQIMDWDGFWVESPAVLYDDSTGIYSMWYTGVGYGPGFPGDTRIRIGYAYSMDGFTWYKDTLHNPVLETGEPGTWDDGWVAVPAVRWLNDHYEMWYCGASIADWLPDSSLDTGRVGYAISPDGIAWEKYPGNPVLSTFEPPVDSGGPWAPDVVWDGNEYHMWYETIGGMYYATAPLSGINAPGRDEDYATFSIHPNPCRYTCTITADEPICTVMLYDITGRCVQSILLETSSCRVYLDLRSMTSGVYFMEVHASRTKTVRKFIVRH